jgi:hypothetical protein
MEYEMIFMPVSCAVCLETRIFFPFYSKPDYTIHEFLGTLPIFLYFRQDLTLRSYDGTHLRHAFQ